MTASLETPEPPAPEPIGTTERPHWSTALRARAATLRRKAGEELRQPADMASLAVFRMAFGAILVWEVYRWLSAGWVRSALTETEFRFSYLGFAWVRPLPSPWMEALWVVLGVLAFGFAIGLAYRVCAVLLFLGFSYWFLQDQALYLNHMYLVCLMLFLACFIPANRLWSVDSVLRPSLRSELSPKGWLWLLRYQMAIVFVFAGIAKINEDWLIRGQPLGDWLSEDTALPIIGPFLTEEWMIYFLAWSGMLFDLFIVFALLWPRTRYLAFAAAVLFNILNFGFFNIGIFPWFAIAACTLFLSPSWPRAVLRLVSSGRVGRPATRLSIATAGPRRTTAVLGIVAVFCATQLVLPVRHHFIPGDVAWTDEGHRYSWRMKLRSKATDAEFVVVDPATGQETRFDPEPYLTNRQERVMRSKPDMVAQFARFIAAEEARNGNPDVEVRAEIYASLNGGPVGLLVSPEYDLADTSPWVVVQPWGTRYPPERTDSPFS